MNIWENAVVTIKGIALLTKLVEGNTLNITRAETGEGYVTPGLLNQLTEVSIPKQTLSFRAVSYPEEGKCKVPCYLTNDGLNTGYTAKQVGLYATDPDEGEILFLILQAPSGYGTIVPSETESPGYSAEWNLYMQYGQADGVNVTVDPSNTVTAEELEIFKSEVLAELSDKRIYALGRRIVAIHQLDEYDNGIYIFPNYMESNTYTPYSWLIATPSMQIILNHDGVPFSYRTKKLSSTEEDWSDIVAIKKADQTYSPDSENAQSGKAVAQALASLVNSAPEALNTLDELAQAMGDDPNFSATVLELIGKKANAEDLADVAMSGSFNDLSDKPNYTLDDVAESSTKWHIRRVYGNSTDGVHYTATIPDLPDFEVGNDKFNGLMIEFRTGTTSTSKNLYLSINGTDEIGIFPYALECENTVAHYTSATPKRKDWLHAHYGYTLKYNFGKWYCLEKTVAPSPSDIGAAPAYTYGTDDMEAGVTKLKTGKLHFVYE